jgi:hypothetical protein
MNTNDPNGTLPAPTETVSTPSADERQWAMFAHLSAVLGGLLTSGWGGSIGFFIGPLIIWLAKKETMPFVDDQAKEALYFAITVSLACVVLMMLTIMSFGIGAVLTIPLLMVIGIAALVFFIIAGVQANQGTRYRYPISLRLVK